MTNQEIAKILDDAAKYAKAVPQMAAVNRMTLTDAYLIQRQSITLREQRGEQITGYKMGFTSKAKMEQMGVHDLIWGILTDAMAIEENEIVDLKRWEGFFCILHL
jgi:2-oxo-3-hexenedioate decarboxylase